MPLKAPINEWTIKIWILIKRMAEKKFGAPGTRPYLEFQNEQVRGRAALFNRKKLSLPLEKPPASEANS